MARMEIHVVSSLQLPRLAYSLVEVALMTGLSLSTVNRRLASGEIRSVKLGRRRLVPMSELERIVDPSALRESNGQTA